MLMVVSESAGRTRTVADVARELSLTLTFYGNAAALRSMLARRTRRIVMLTERDLEAAVVAALVAQADAKQTGLVIAGKQDALRDSDKASLLEELSAFRSVVWVSKRPSAEELAEAARQCRRAMLKVSREELERALTEQEFLIQYQPKVERSDAAEWRTREAEALLRWRHPEHGLMGPLEFLPELEAFDLMGAVSEFVLDEAAKQLLAWRDAGLDLNSCINLAPSLLSRPTLADEYAAIVRKHGLSCSSFTFEIAEHDVATSEAPHLKMLNALRSKGFRLSLDDYGVAAASLSTFEQLPFDEIKIHASALKRAMDGPVPRAVLAAVTGLAHNLGISVCAEGVEDQETFDFLKTIECDKMQGFLISEAVMPDIVRRVYSSGAEVEEVA